MTKVRLVGFDPNGAPAGYYYQAGVTAYLMAPAGTYSLAGASAATTDPAGTYSGAGASAPTLAAPGTYIPVTGATSSAAEIVDRAGTYSAAGASAPTTDPAGTHSGAGASTPTLAAAGTYIPVTGATSAGAKIVSPPGTYTPPGASAPITDPGGTYSAAGATAPTMDPAGTYSSPYALNRLFLESDLATPANSVLSFNSATAVANYYGAKSAEASLAKEFFAGYGDTSATMLFTRYTGAGGRPHLVGANISKLTFKQLRRINGSISITFDGYKYSGSITLSGVKSFTAAAKAIQRTLNSDLPVEAATVGSSITPVSVSFTASVSGGTLLQVTSVASGSIELGAQISGPGIAAGSQIVTQRTGTPGGPGLYTLFAGRGTVSSETMIETYGVLTVGSVTSGTVAVGEEVTGAGVLPYTAIDGNLSGSGPGSTWLVNNAQTVAGENMTMTAAPLAVDYNSIVGATANRDFFEVQPNGDFGYDYNPSSLSYMRGAAAAALGLTRASGALDTTPGGELPSASAYMNNLVQNEDSQFSSFQATWEHLAQVDPGYLGDLAAWGQSTDGLYQFLSRSTATTPPAGSSIPTTDPAGTYSGPGASAPTPATAGTYIPVTGATSAAAEIVDSPGSYSLAGASAPTLAQPGYYVPTARASSETPCDPGYYTPYPGATAEIKALPPAISGTVAGQTIAPLETDTPFSSVTITNTDTSDTLTIQLTGGGGTLTDGAGFDGLTMSAPDVYILSGTAAAITRELEALVFTPNAVAGTRTFALTDTSSAGTSASNANTTVNIESKPPPVVVSVPNFLANQSSLDQTKGGFDILGVASIITANLNQLNDQHINSITILDNNQIGPSAQQLTSDATAIGKLGNANSSPVLLAVSDTAANVEAGLSTLVADAGEIASIAASNGPVVASVSTFLADQSTLDKIAGGFAISDTASDVAQNLNALNADTNVTSIALTDGGVPTLSLSIKQALSDMLAQSEITGPHKTVIADSAAAMISIAQAIYLSGKGISVVGAPVVASGTVAAMAALARTKASTFVRQGYTLAVLDTAADIERLRVAQINELSARDVLLLQASDANVALSAKLAVSLEAANMTVTAPNGSIVTVSDTAAKLEDLTASQIDGLAAIGVTGLVSTNANVSYSPTQTAAIFANGLNASASGAHTVTENFADGAYSVAHFNVTGKAYSSYEDIYNSAATVVVDARNNVNGSGRLLLDANGLTITSASGSDSVTTGSDTFAINPHTVATTKAAKMQSETFVYGAGFGQDTVDGFLATRTGHDLLQFSASMFGFSSTSSQTADAQALLSNFTSGTTSTTITDLQGDTLTLNGATIATLEAHLRDFKFT